MKLRKYLLCSVLTGTLLFSGCTGSTANNSQSTDASDTETALKLIDMTKWQYDEENDVYWQTGISYCASPADESYETLGIYIPGAYLNGTANDDGTYTCELNSAGTAGGYTAQDAPMVIPVDTPGYAAMAAPTGYESNTASYTDAGFVYIYAGCRGRDAGAPAGVTDLKAAIRYIRYNQELLPGSTERIFSFGMSGGGAQSALLGATGDSELYTPYLEAIGAAEGVSDAVSGSMCWCPITNLDYADAAYEWNMGVTRTDLSDEMQEISDGLASAYADYINDLGLTDEEGNVLLLTESAEGIYQAGSYYDYLKEVIETSLNHFLEDTTFPYTAGSSMSGGFGGGRGGNFADGDLPDGDLPDGDFADGDFADGDLPDKDFRGGGGFKGGELQDGELQDGNLPDGELQDGNLPDGDLPDKDFKGGGGFKGGDLPDGELQEDYYAMDGIQRAEGSATSELSGTYETVQDYIDALNADTVWVEYDSETNTASITSIADYVTTCKKASKNLGAFDQLDGGQGENTLFGYGDGSGAHFDSTLAQLLEDTEYYDSYTSDLEKTDFLGNTVDYRLNMYTPLYYLSAYYDGYQTSTVASYWRIRSGINQSDTALSTEVNLALALKAYGVDVDFETVWGQAHVEAERTGNATDNFIDWVNDCCS